MTANTVALLLDETPYELRTLLEIEGGLAGNPIQRDFFEWAQWTRQDFATALGAYYAYKGDRTWQQRANGAIEIPFPYVYTEHNVAQPGMSPQWETHSVQEVFDRLQSALTMIGFEPNFGEYFSRSEEADLDEPFPKHRWLSCFATSRTSEGHYIHVEAIYQGQRRCIFLGKTFYGFDYAWVATMAIAKILQA